MALTLHYDFKSLPTLAAKKGPVLTAVRATLATMVDRDGYIREVQAGEARFDGATFNHNLGDRSEELDDASWSAVNASVTADQVANPINGAVTADKLVEANDTNLTHVLLNPVNVKIGHVYTVSIYAKAAERDQLKLDFSAAGWPQNQSIWFDLTAGTVGTIEGTPTGGIEDKGDGWYRCWVTHTADESASAHVSFTLGIDTEDSLYDGDGSSGLYLFGYHWEDVSGAWAGQNLHTQSNTFSNSIWSKLNATVAQDAEDFEGSANTAWTITGDGGDGLEFVGIRGDAVVSSLLPSTPYIYSIDVKAGAADWVYMYDAGNTSKQAWFNVSTGAIGTAHADIDASIEALDNGFYRCNIKFLTHASSSPRFYISAADDDGTVGWTNSSAQDVLIVSRGQCEGLKPTQTTPLGYVATTTAAVTTYSPSAYIATTTVKVTSLGGANNGLLVEEARTNICLRSEDMNAAVAEWSNFGNGDSDAANSNVAVAPDGSMTAARIIDNGATGTGGAGVQQTIVTATSTTYAWSVFFKADQLDWAYLEVSGMGALAISAYFDLTNGVVGATVGADNTSEFIEDYGNGWYRCGIVFDSDAVDTSASYIFRVAEANNDNIVDLDSTSSIFVWGADVEVGAFPTSYIGPTLAASVTRNRDEISSTDLSNITGITAATAYAHGVRPHSELTGNAIFSIDGSSVERFQLGSGSSARANGLNRSSANGDNTLKQSSSASNELEANEEMRWAFAVADDDVEAYFNGVLETTGPTESGAAIPAWTDIRVGGNYAGVGSEWNGLIKELRLYDERFDAAGLEDLSNGIFPAGLGFVRPLAIPLARPLARNL